MTWVLWGPYEARRGDKAHLTRENGVAGSVIRAKTLCGMTGMVKITSGEGIAKCKRCVATARSGR